uniref:Ig-like domain-containing protein n=1 Tax=Nothobranchius furzeri TaxID=105023 RepID=A0A8C6M4R7_NOTFU
MDKVCLFVCLFKVVHPPVVRIIQPTAAELTLSDSIVLTCLVSGFFPANIIVHWEENGQELPSVRYINSPPWGEQGRDFYSMRSKLNVTRSQDEKSTYACIVRHESSQTPVKTSINDVFGELTTDILFLVAHLSSNFMTFICSLSDLRQTYSRPAPGTSPCPSTYPNLVGVTICSSKRTLIP